MTAAKRAEGGDRRAEFNERPEIHLHRAFGRRDHAWQLPVGNEGAGLEGKLDSALGAGLHGGFCDGQIRSSLREQGQPIRRRPIIDVLERRQ